MGMIMLVLLGSGVGGVAGFVVAKVWSSYIFPNSMSYCSGTAALCTAKYLCQGSVNKPRWYRGGNDKLGQLFLSQFLNSCKKKDRGTAGTTFLAQFL